MVDFSAEEAELELDQLVRKLQKKYQVHSEVMQFILNNLAKDYELKAIAEKVVCGEGQ